MDVLEKIKNGLIVSCQARVGGPLDDPLVLAAMAKAAEEGGAVGIRANWPQNIGAIKERVNIPIIGIYKEEYPDSDVYITPTYQEARQLIELGVEIIALDATMRERPCGQSLQQLLSAMRSKSDVLIMGDISTYQEAVNADKLGFDLVATTLLGYTEETKGDKVPDMELVHQISANIKVPLIVEGRIHTLNQAAAALSAGAHAVVIGTAITDISWVTSYYLKAMHNGKKKL